MTVPRAAEDEPAVRPNTDDGVCPYFAASRTSNLAHDCRSPRGPEDGVTAEYAAAYCTTGHHVGCSIFIASRAAAPRSPATPERESTTAVGDKPPVAHPARRLAATMPVWARTIRYPLRRRHIRPEVAFMLSTVVVVLAWSALSLMRLFASNGAPEPPPATVSGSPTGGARLAQGALPTATTAGTSVAGDLAAPTRSGTEEPGRRADTPTAVAPVIEPTPAATRTARATPSATPEPTTTVMEPTRPARQPTRVARPTVAATATRAPAATRTVVRPTPTTARPTAAPTATPRPEPAPTDAPQPPTPTAPDVQPPAGEGIGLTRAQWERRHGRPSRTDGAFVEYENGEYRVAYVADRVRSIERIWGARNALPINTARAVSEELLPGDSALLSTSSPEPGRVVDEYRSPSLADQFPEGEDDPWLGGRRGAFSVLYRVDRGLVRSVVIVVGEAS